MELRQLRYFIAVAEHLSFRRVAERLHVSQPPLSRQIANLETELGVRWLERDKHRVMLSEPGRVFLVRVREIVAKLEQAANLARGAGQGAGANLPWASAARPPIHCCPASCANFVHASPGSRSC